MGRNESNQTTHPHPLANILPGAVPPPPPPPIPLLGSKGRNSTFFSHDHVAYQHDSKYFYTHPTP